MDNCINIVTLETIYFEYINKAYNNNIKIKCIENIYLENIYPIKSIDNEVEYFNNIKINMNNCLNNN